MYFAYIMHSASAKSKIKCQKGKCVDKMFSKNIPLNKNCLFELYLNTRYLVYLVDGLRKLVWTSRIGQDKRGRNFISRLHDVSTYEIELYEMENFKSNKVILVYKTKDSRISNIKGTYIVTNLFIIAISMEFRVHCTEGHIKIFFYCKNLVEACVG